MSRLFVSTFFRMLKKIVFWILLICMFAYGVYSASNAASEANGGFALDGCFFDFAPFMGLVAAILTSMFIGSEYSDGTIRNKLVVGHSRMRIYLANLIVCSVACVLISLAYITGGVCGRQRQRRGTANKNKRSYHVPGMQHFGFRCLYKHYDDACDIEYKQSRKCGREYAAGVDTACVWLFHLSET